jgi:YggT family protein
VGSSYVTNPIAFLINTLFSLYILLIMLRFLLASVRADFYNPASQFLVKITNPVITPLRKVIPSVGKLDTSTLLLMLALQMLSLFLVSLLGGETMSFGGLLARSAAELIRLLLNIFLFSILILVIISWINPGTHNPVTSLLHSIAEPLLGPCRRLIPAISGIDFSPIIALIGIQLCKMLVLPPLYHLAQ